MAISREDAVAALRDVEEAQTRTRLARAYRVGSPHLILWGVIWIIGYALTGLVPSRDLSLIWPSLCFLGVIIGVVLRRRGGLALAQTGEPTWRWWAAWVAILCFSVATYAVMKPVNPAQYQVYPALIISLIYMLAGAWGATRYLGIGAGVFALALIGFFFLGPWLPYWMAVVGGGALILGGVWLRRA
jgi:hypothetical protein